MLQVVGAAGACYSATSRLSRPEMWLAGIVLICFFFLLLAVVEYAYVGRPSGVRVIDEAEVSFGEFLTSFVFPAKEPTYVEMFSTRFNQFSVLLKKPQIGYRYPPRPNASSGNDLHPEISDRVKFRIFAMNITDCHGRIPDYIYGGIPSVIAKQENKARSLSVPVGEISRVKTVQDHKGFLGLACKVEGVTGGSGCILSSIGTVCSSVGGFTHFTRLIGSYGRINSEHKKRGNRYQELPPIQSIVLFLIGVTACIRGLWIVWWDTGRWNGYYGWYGFLILLAGWILCVVGSFWLLIWIFDRHNDCSKHIISVT